MVERLTNLAYAINGGVGGLRMQLKITNIPPSWRRGQRGDDYDDTWMSRLEQVGYDRALGDSAGSRGTPSK